MKSLRLNHVLRLIPDETPLLFDIGTDHAFLAIAAIKVKHVHEVYAVDNRPGPLKMAQRNVVAAGLTQQIHLVLANGLHFLNQVQIHKPAVCVVAGLGSNTILEILQGDEPLIDSYILCSNTNPWQIRQWANDQKYTLVDELFFTENRHPYWLLKIDKTFAFKPIDNIDFGDFHWHRDNGRYRRHLQHQFDIKKEFALRISNLEQKQNQMAKNQALESYLALWN